MRELIAASVLRKPIVALIDLDRKHGGLNLGEVQAELLTADRLYAKWEFEADKPRGVALHEQLMQSQPIEWNRLGHFQDVVRLEP